MNKRNYQKELDKLISKLEKDQVVPRLLIHSCCAPCSSGVVPQLDNYDITLLFYNPNIDSEEEYNLLKEVLYYGKE